MMAPSSPNVSKPRTPRLRQSCDGCFIAKVKCSKGRPICQRCLTCGIECRYSPSSRSGKPKSDASPQSKPTTMQPKTVNMFPEVLDDTMGAFDYLPAQYHSSQIGYGAGLGLFVDHGFKTEPDFIPGDGFGADSEWDTVFNLDGGAMDWSQQYSSPMALASGLPLTGRGQAMGSSNAVPTPTEWTTSIETPGFSSCSSPSMHVDTLSDLTGFWLPEHGRPHSYDTSMTMSPSGTWPVDDGQQTTQEDPFGGPEGLPRVIKSEPHPHPHPHTSVSCYYTTEGTASQALPLPNLTLARPISPKHSIPGPKEGPKCRCVDNCLRSINALNYVVPVLSDALALNRKCLVLCTQMLYCNYCVSRPLSTPNLLLIGAAIGKVASVYQDLSRNIREVPAPSGPESPPTPSHLADSSHYRFLTDSIQRQSTGPQFLLMEVQKLHSAYYELAAMCLKEQDRDTMRAMGAFLDKTISRIQQLEPA